MPNWCECDLDVIGEKEDLEKFVNAVRGKDENENTEFTFENILPIPEGYKEDGRWYEWCIDNWDTKWNACDVYLNKVKDKRYTYHFSTAWSPPKNVIAKASKLYPDLTFNLKYYEGGEGYCGQLKFKNGDILSEKYDSNYRGPRGG